MAADLRLGIALVLLLGAAVGALHLAGVRIRRQVVVAAVRAAVQLAVIGVVLGVVFRYPGAAALVLLVMLTTATRTAARRLRDFTGAPRAVLLSSLAGALTTLVVAFGTGAVDFSVRYIVEPRRDRPRRHHDRLHAGRPAAARRHPQPARGGRGLAGPGRHLAAGGAATSPGPPPGRRCCRRSTRPGRSGW